MWVRAWIALSVSATLASSQYINDYPQSPSDFQWGWQMSSDQGQGSSGHYYVKLPQAEQRVLYKADKTGYHGAVNVNTSSAHHTSSAQFALGQKALDLEARHMMPQQFQDISSQSDPVEIFLLQQQPQEDTGSGAFVVPSNSLDNYGNLQPLLKILSTPEKDNKNQEIISKPLLREVNRDQNSGSNVVQVFKDHKCVNDANNNAGYNNEAANAPVAQPLTSINGNYGLRQKHHRYKHIEVTPRYNARNERFYFRKSMPTVAESLNNEDGIKKLVKSTQDLISNEDLITINNAVEHQYREQSEDLIKPRSRQNNQLKELETLRTSPTQITVRAHIKNISPHKNHNENNENQTQKLNPYKFSSPIVVEDPIRDDYKKVATTVGAFIENGFEVIGLKNDGEIEYRDENYLNGTPRPVGQNYLAPITVAIRLLNNNESNEVRENDHEGSDSELIEAKLPQAPTPQKTDVVGIQQSIPIPITNINNVEYIEYLNEGMPNRPLALAQHVGNYVNALRKAQKYGENLNYILNRYATSNLSKEDAKKTLATSENVHRGVTTEADDSYGQKRSENVNFFVNSHNTGFDYDDSQKLVSIIAREKEEVDKYSDLPVPRDRPSKPRERNLDKPVEVVTKYKPYPVEVHHPYPVEVKVPYPVEQQVYIDRPVHIPYPVEKIVEKQVPVVIPTPVAVPIGIPVEHKVLYPVPYEKQIPVPVEKPVEKIVHKEIPVPYPVEKRIPYPVHYETKVPVPYPVEKKVPVLQPVPVPVHVHHAYPVDRVVEKKVPYPVHIEKIVEKEVPVKVPYPVEKVVEKIIEKPVFVTKYLDSSYPIDKKLAYPLERVIEKPVPYPIRHEVRMAYPVEKISEKPVHVPNIYQSENIIQKDESIYHPQYHMVSNKEDFKPQLELVNRTYPTTNNKWSNQYASSYQYINGTQLRKPKENKLLTNEFLYISNTPNYSGLLNNPYRINNEKHRESKYNNNRSPRVVQIEYGFKPPLIPSTQVDLNGLPVQNNEQSK